MKEKGMRKGVIGVVVSDKMDRSILVQTERKVKHPRYGKYVRRITKYMADNPDNAAKTGDRVEIVQTRPLSKKKCWRVAKIVDKAVGAGPQEQS